MYFGRYIISEAYKNYDVLACKLCKHCYCNIIDCLLTLWGYEMETENIMEYTILNRL